MGGKDTATLEAQIKDVVSGKTKHKKAIKLTDAEIADIAAFWSSIESNSENLDLTEFLSVRVDDVHGARGTDRSCGSCAGSRVADADRASA